MKVAFYEKKVNGVEVYFTNSTSETLALGGAWVGSKGNK
jgi:hypothetical protein